MDHFPPENEDDNREYKFHLTGLDCPKISKLASQMRYRLENGNGEAVYLLGVTDDGYPLGLSKSNIDESCINLEKIAKEINAEVQLFEMSEERSSLPKEYQNLYKKINGPNTTARFLAQMIVRLSNYQNNYIGIRIAVAGSVDAGKSSTVAVLTRGIHDNGNGSARAYVFNHPHESDRGRTSSISQQILGFDSKGQPIGKNRFNPKSLTWPEIVEKSSKIITFYDLAGHQQYLRTTIQGFSGTYPDYCMIVISANKGVLQMTMEHLRIAIMRDVPLIVVITKIDMVQEQEIEEKYQKNLNYLLQLLKSPGAGKMPYIVKDRQDVLHCSEEVKHGRIVPIIKVSNVTGTGIDFLQLLLSLLQPRTDFAKHLKEPVHYSVQGAFKVPGVGTVINGFVLEGIITKKEYWLGPFRDGQFHKVYVKDIHDKRVPVSELICGQEGTLALRNVNRADVFRGMVLLDGKISKPKCFTNFIADIKIIGNSSVSVKKGYTPVIHVSNTRSAAKIVRIFEEDGQEIGVLRNNDKALIEFSFSKPVYFHEDSKVLFREGRTRGVGHIVKIL